MVDDDCRNASSPVDPFQRMRDYVRNEYSDGKHPIAIFNALWNEYGPGNTYQKSDIENVVLETVNECHNDKLKQALESEEFSEEINEFHDNVETANVEGVAQPPVQPTAANADSSWLKKHYRGCIVAGVGCLSVAISAAVLAGAAYLCWPSGNKTKAEGFYGDPSHYKIINIERGDEELRDKFGKESGSGGYIFVECEDSDKDKEKFKIETTRQGAKNLDNLKKPGEKLKRVLEEDGYLRKTKDDGTAIGRLDEEW